MRMRPLRMVPEGANGWAQKGSVETRGIHHPNLREAFTMKRFVE